MAWRAKVLTKNRNPRSGGILLNVVYFDEAAPDVYLAGKNFRFDLGTSRVEIIAEIRRVGIILKARYDEREERRLNYEQKRVNLLIQAESVYGTIAPEAEFSLT